MLINIYFFGLEMNDHIIITICPAPPKRYTRATLTEKYRKVICTAARSDHISRDTIK